MIPGPDQIVACPKCNGLAKYMTLLSGNTFGARVWTDGKQYAPMLPSPPAVVKCQQCAECYWLADAREVCNVPRTAPPVVQEPSEDEYYHALQKGLAAGSQQERTLRILAWWRRNDAFRCAPQAEAASTATASGTCRTNLEALASLLEEEEENDRLMKAEVFRELGQFESAKLALSLVSSPEYATVVHQLRILCDAGDAVVRELQFGG